MASAERPALPPFVSDRPGGCSIRVRVIPRSPRTAIAGERDGALLVRLSAPPVDGEANAALIEFLAKSLGRPRRDVRLASGDRSRDKRIEVDGPGAVAAARALMPGK
jgi:uncharacterized protein (TIGR00251 family)